MATILRPFLIDASLFLSCSSLVAELAKEIGRGQNICVCGKNA
jgi:hypothetical protein